MTYAKPAIVETMIASHAIMGRKDGAIPDVNGDPAALPSTGSSYAIDE